MKCVIEGNATDECRRCRRSGLPCIFVPRANAATLQDTISSLPYGDFKTDVLRRLSVIEERLGLPAASNPGSSGVLAYNDELSPDQSSLGSLWEAGAVLQRSAPASVPSILWRKDTVKDLWLA
jgi:hypothetical protein